MRGRGGRLDLFAFHRTKPQQACFDIAGRDFFKEKGGQLYPLDEAEVTRWQKAVEPMLAQQVKDLEAKGFKKSDAEGYVKFIHERIDYWAKQEKDRKIPSVNQ